MLSFIASIDNVAVSLFLSNARTDMLPIRLWGMMESTLDVRIAIASGVLISCVIVLVMAASSVCRSACRSGKFEVGRGATGRRAVCTFGEVLAIPEPTGRTYFDCALFNLRPSARPSLSLSRKEDLSSLPLAARQMERHEFSFQSFGPIEVGRWLVVVAPHAREGGPDMRGARALLAGPRQGVTYGANVWHHPLTILDRPAAFADYMWLDGGKKDEEFFALPAPVTI